MPVFVNIGNAYPNGNRAQVVIWGERVPEFEEMLNAIDDGGAWVSLTGYIGSYEGVPQIDVRRLHRVDLADIRGPAHWEMALFLRPYDVLTKGKRPQRREEHMAAVVAIVIIVAIVITIANMLGKAKSYSSIQDAFAKTWASAFGTPVPEQALSAFTRMVSFITEKEVDRSFGGAAADDHSPLSDSLDDFRRAVNYDNNKVAVPIAIPVREPCGILRSNSDFCTSAPPFSAGEKDGALCLPATM